MMADTNQLMSNTDGTVGVMYSAITDERFHFEMKEMYLHGIRFQIYGNQSVYDNFICNGQEILLPKDNSFKKLAIVGFNEFYSYKSSIKAVSGDVVTECPVMFYHMNENIIGLFKNERSEESFKVLSGKFGAWQKLNYFCDLVEIPEHVEKIICPENIESHIAAITAIC